MHSWLQESQQQAMNSVMHGLGSTNALVESLRSDVAQLGVKVQESLRGGLLAAPPAEKPVPKGGSSIQLMSAGTSFCKSNATASRLYCC